MNTIQSSSDVGSLINIINQTYPVYVDQVTLHREMIGYVYIAQGRSQKYVLKLYRRSETENALCSIGIILYLKANNYPAVSIIPARSGELHTTIAAPEGPSVAILFEYVEGVEPRLENEMEGIARQMGRLHQIMKDYPEPLIQRRKDFFIDRYLAILRELKYPEEKVEDLEDCGKHFWGRMERLPLGFCHGDFHTGNIIQTSPGRYVLFDFDVVSRTSPVIDVATLCDGSDFNRFDDAAYEETLRLFDRFYLHYRKEMTLSGAEIAAIFDFIPIRHYEIIATIARSRGLDCLSRAFLDEQYDWILRWMDLCERRRSRPSMHLAGGLD